MGTVFPARLRCVERVATDARTQHLLRQLFRAPGAAGVSAPDRTLYLVAASVLLLVFVAMSGARPYDRTTWLLEVLPVLIALPLLWATYRSYPLTSLLYACIFVHATVLIVGGAYTYARVPFGFYLADLLDLTRNPYDKIGHFLQGF